MPSMSPTLTEAYAEEKTKQHNQNSIQLPCTRDCTFLSSVTKLEVLNSTQQAINKDVPSVLPKQLPRCERKLLHAEAMDSSAETRALIIRSSTLAISAARRGGGEEVKGKK